VSTKDLPKERFPNPGIKAQEAEEEVVRFDSGVLMYYMMKMGILIPWTLQDSYTSPSNSIRLLTNM